MFPIRTHQQQIRVGQIFLRKNPISTTSGKKGWALM